MFGGCSSYTWISILYKIMLFHKPFTFEIMQPKFTCQSSKTI
jgi:hypothetical protein